MNTLLDKRLWADLTHFKTEANRIWFERNNIFKTKLIKKKIELNWTDMSWFLIAERVMESFFGETHYFFFS